MKWIGQHIYDLVSRFRNDVFLEGISTSTETDILVVDSSNKISKRAASGLTSGTATLASTVTVTDSTTDTAFPVVFHDESNALLDDTGAFTYNPNTGTLIAPNLTVSGTTTTINTTNLNVEDKNIILNYHATSDTSSTADGAGITIQDAVDASNNATILWTASSDTFTFSHNINATLATAAQTNITSVGNTLSIGNSTSDNAQLNIQNQTTDAEGGVLVFKKTKGLIGGILQTPNDDDEIGRTSYTYSDDASITEYDYARTVVTATDVSNGSESGKYQILASGQGSLRNVISGEGGSTSAEIDVTIANGAASVTTIAGTLTMGSTATLDNSGLLQVAGQTNITSLGTLTNLQVDYINANASTLTITDSSDTGDGFQIVTTTHGATTLLTVDDDATAADLTLDVDGDIILDPHGKNIYHKVGGTTVNDFDLNSGTYKYYFPSQTDDYFEIGLAAHGATTLTTVDAAAAAAHFEIEADGNIILDPQNATTGVQIDGTANTTANALNIDCDSLTTGNAIFVDVDSALTTNNTVDIMKIDFDKSGNVTSGNTVNVYGLEIDLNDNATSNVGNTFLTGIHIGIDHANANGIAYQTGVAVQLTDGDVASTVGFSSYCEDGGVDFKAMSTADTGDYFTIATTTHGATTLTTVDDDATAAHFEIAADGNITLDAAGDIALEAAGGDVTIEANDVTITSSASGQSPEILLLNENTGTSGASLQFKKSGSDSGADNDELGIVTFYGENDAGQAINYMLWQTAIYDATDGEEAVRSHFYLRSHGSASWAAGLSMYGSSSVADVVDVTLGAGIASTTTVEGDLAVGGDDVTIYNAVNDSNPTLSMGSSATDRFEIQSVYNSGAQTIDYVNFTTYTTSSASHDGRYFFKVDEVELVKIIDLGLFVTGGSRLQVEGEGATLHAYDPTTSSATEGGALRLSSDDGAAMADNHRLGIITFEGAEDASNTLTVGAQIEAFCEAGWSASENGGRMVFSTTDGNASISEVLRLDSDKLATFAGDIKVNGETSTFTNSGSGYPNIILETTNTGVSASGHLMFKKDAADTEDGELLGYISFYGEDEGNNQTQFGAIQCEISESDETDEAGKLTLSVAESDGTNTALSPGLILEGEHATDGQVDVTIANGAASTTTVAGDLNVTSRIRRKLSVSSSTDGDYDGDVVYFGGTTSMTVGKIYHYKSDGTWELANADAVATADGLLGVALGAASDTNGMLLRGMVTLDHDPGAIGDVLYVQSDNAGTPGNATATAPSASGDCVRIIGYQVSHASNGNIWFNPDNTFVEVA